MSYITISLIATCAYVLAAWLQQQRLVEPEKKLWLTPLLLTVMGWLCHSFSLYSRLFDDQGLVLDLATAMSLTGWVIIAIIMLSNLREPLANLLIVVLPVAALAMIMGLLTPASSSGKFYSAGVLIHILTSVVAYSLFAIAVCQAVLVTFQNNQLKRRQQSRMAHIIRNLPPLQTMERLLYQMLLVGLMFLTVALASGLIFLEDMFTQKVAHKSLLSIIAWIIFIVLILGHYQLGWRGRKAMGLTFTGFGILVLAWFGSTLMLEYLL